MTKVGLLALVLSSCAPGVILYEPAPVMVTAARPLPPPPPRIEVKRDRIQVSETIYFETNQAIIRADSLKTLADLARIINDHPEVRRISVEGHTDSVGSARDNLALSKRRAAAVRAYLIERGVDGRRLVAEGYGGADPIASNANEDGRAKNRRVAFRVVNRDDRTADARGAQ